MRGILSAFVMTCCLVACAHPAHKNSPVDSAIATVMSSDLSFPAGTYFSWSPGTSQFFDDPRLDNADIHELLRGSIEDELTSRGYLVSGESGYRISYVAALEKALSDDEINKYFGVDPGLPAQSVPERSYEKGTVIIDVSDPTTNKSLWRSAMQGYVELKLSRSARKDRVRSTVSSMFMSFPRGN